MDKSKRATNVKAASAKGPAPKPHEKTSGQPTSTNDAAGQKPEAKADKVTHGAAHPAKK